MRAFLGYLMSCLSLYGFFKVHVWLSPLQFHQPSERLTRGPKTLEWNPKSEILSPETPKRSLSASLSLSTLIAGKSSASSSFHSFVIYGELRQPPALPYRLQYSTIGRLSLNRRVRDGHGCFP